MTMTIAAFDFDCTITTRDTLLPFLYYINSKRTNIINSIKLLPTAVTYKIGLIENHFAKEAVLQRFLLRHTYDSLLVKAKEFATHRLPTYVQPKALQRIRWHQQQGHRCILISAGLEIYLSPWANALQFDDVIATQLAVTEQGFVSGKIAGKNCFGQEKVNRLLEIVGPKENFILYAYGDSRGDRELLALADHSFYRHMPS